MEIQVLGWNFFHGKIATQTEFRVENPGKKTNRRHCGCGTRVEEYSLCVRGIRACRDYGPQREGGNRDSQQQPTMVLHVPCSTHGHTREYRQSWPLFFKTAGNSGQRKQEHEAEKCVRKSGSRKDDLELAEGNEGSRKNARPPAKPSLSNPPNEDGSGCPEKDIDSNRYQIGGATGDPIDYSYKAEIPWRRKKLLPGIQGAG